MTGTLCAEMNTSHYTAADRKRLAAELPDEVLNALSSSGFATDGFIGGMIYGAIVDHAPREADMVTLSERLHREQRAAERRFRKLLRAAVKRIARQVFLS